MRPRLSPRGLRKVHAWEHALRFAFGGIVTVAAGLVARTWGPTVGGLFLAFPAILPASLTLVKQHDGRARAVDDARGGRLGSVGLAAFALVLWATAEAWPPALTLVAATLAWLAVDVGGWWLTYGRARAR